MQKVRENNETILKLTSQLQEMQKHLNSVNDSGDLQDVKSNHCGRLFYVPSRLVTVPSSRSMLPRDKRLPFDTWNKYIGITGKRFW